MAPPIHSRRRVFCATLIATMLSGALASGVASQAGETVDIPIEGFAFPAELVVDAGTTVRWQNLDPAPHTITAGDGSFDSGQVASGSAFEQVFDQSGSVAYSCLIHPSMTGTITVLASGDGDDPTGTADAVTADAVTLTTDTTILRRATVFDTDPLGIGGPALTLLAPEGWLVEGGPVWRHQYSNLATYEGRVASPDLLRAVEFFPLFPQIWQEGGIPFFPAGSLYLGNEVRPPISDPAVFLETLILPAYRADFSPRIIAREPLPDAASAYAAVSLPGTEIVAERILTEHFVDGERMLEEFTVVLTFTPNPALPGSVFWMPQQLFSLRAPAGEFDAARPVLQTIASSPVLDPDWGVFYEYVLGLSIQNGLEAIRAAGAASQLIAQTNAEINDIIVRSYEERQAANDTIHEAFIQTIRGVDTYGDPFSDRVFELPLSYNYTYASDRGTVILTNDPSYDPAQAMPDQTWEAITVER